MYEKLMNQFTPVLRLMTGAVLFLVGIIRQIASGSPLDMYAFYIMAAAMLCFCNVIMCKISRSDADIILYVILNMAVLIVGFALVAGKDITMGITIAVICVIAAWILDAALFSCEGILKRIVTGFVAVVFSVILIALVFIVPILIWTQSNS